MKREKIIEEESRYIIHTYKRAPLVLVKGKGTKVWDTEGKEYLDFLAGIAVNALGHCHPKIVEAIKKQAQTLIHVSNIYYIEPQVRLGKMLARESFGGKSFFCNSGAEANEAAIKLARKYGSKSSPPRWEIITMENSFHGRTLATLTATGEKKYQKGFAPLVPGFKYAPFNDLKAVEKAISPQTVALMVEPLQGEGGINIATPRFLEGLSELSAEHDLLLIFDEIQCGLGRTGKMFAYQHYGVTPHIMTLAKSLGGGVPIGVMIAAEEVASSFEPGNHASTFGGNPLASAAGIAFLETLSEENLLENTRKMGSYFKTKLDKLKEKYDFIKEVRGRGLMLGVELTFPGKEIVDQCLQKGLLLNCTAEKVLRFLPPLIVGTEEIDQALEILDSVLKTH